MMKNMFAKVAVLAAITATYVVVGEAMWITPVLANSVPVPEQIIIPSANVNADIVKVGVTKTNNLDVPPNYYQAGWYKYGPLPGNPGNAVIDGHVDNGGKINGPFKNLRQAKIGDEIVVRMSDGLFLIYTVSSTSVTSTKQFPKESVFHGDYNSVLKIITCHGKFVPAAKTYDQRLIVTAVLKQRTFAYSI